MSRTKENQPPRATDLPPLRGKDGKLLKLKNTDFPATRDGQLLYCDYHIAVWQERRKKMEFYGNPETRKAARIERLRKKLEQLEAAR